MPRSEVIEQVASPNTGSSDSITSNSNNNSIPSNRFMKTTSFIFGFCLSILLLICAKMLINDVGISVFESPDAALVSFTALIPLVIELPKKTKKNLFVSISAIVVSVLALFTYCGTFIAEGDNGQDNFFSIHPLFFNIPLIILGLLIGILYCVNKEND